MAAEENNKMNLDNMTKNIIFKILDKTMFNMCKKYRTMKEI